MTGSAEPLLSERFDERSLSGLRQRVSAAAAGTGLDDLTLSKFVLAVHEITINAVRHGGGEGELRLWRDRDGLRCEVVDFGRGIPAERLGALRPSTGQIGGWGLWLARQICTVEATTGPDGTRVTLRHPVPAP
jgi:anti-sigma regulatory factor (Ser/Thr protein kinase)